MALTFTNLDDRAYRILGNQKEVAYSVLFDTSYPTGGEAVTAANLGLNKIDSLRINGFSFDGSQTVNVASASWDATNSKIQLWNETPAEVSNTNDCSGTTVYVSARGY